jgi:hypothetical protein
LGSVLAEAVACEGVATLDALLSVCFLIAVVRCWRLTSNIAFQSDYSCSRGVSTGAV